jgi:hypothetical protein
MKVVLVLAALIAVCSCQKPVFVPQYEGRYTEFFQRNIEGKWVTWYEVGTEYVDRTKNESRYEVVVYEDLDGTQVAIPEERVHTPTHTYVARQNDVTGAFECDEYKPSPPFDPTTLTWTYAETTFATPSARNSQESVWGARTVDIFETTTKDPSGETVKIALGQDSFTTRPVLVAITVGQGYRSIREYRDVFEGPPPSQNFVVPTYFQCKPQP